MINGNVKTQIPVMQGKPTTMRAVVISAPNQLEVHYEYDLPFLETGETLIEVKYSGICGSDLHLLHGEHPTATFPIVPGHEFVGQVVEICGNNYGLQLGDKVIAQPVVSCRHCEPCAKGQDNVCKNLQFIGIHLDGGFAQYVKASTHKVYRIPPNMDEKVACLAEPLAVAVHDVRRSDLKVGENALIIGGGPIGLLIAIVARYAGASQVLVSEVCGYRREVAHKLGLETVNPLEEDARRRMLALSDGLGYDVVFEASGSQSGIACGIDLAKITGRVMVVGMTRDPYPVDLATVFSKELTLQGVRIHSQYNFIGAANLLAQPFLQKELTQIITHVFPVEDAIEAFELAQSKENFLKILVEM